MPLSAADLTEIKAIVTSSLDAFKIDFLKQVSDTVDEKIQPLRTELTELSATVNTQRELINDLSAKLNYADCTCE